MIIFGQTRNSKKNIAVFVILRLEVVCCSLGLPMSVVDTVVEIEYLLL